MNTSAPFPATVNPQQLLTKGGRQCAFPVNAKGKPKWSQCVPIGGVPACPVDSNQWEVRVLDCWPHDATEVISTCNGVAKCLHWLCHAMAVMCLKSLLLLPCLSTFLKCGAPWRHLVGLSCHLVVQACADNPPTPAPAVQGSNTTTPAQSTASTPSEPFSNTTAVKSAASPPPAPQGLIAQNGRQCLSPLDYRGTPVTGCITFAAVPGAPLCWVAGDNGDGSWNLCRAGSEVSVRGIASAAAQTRSTSTQQPCVLPSVFQVSSLHASIF